MKVSVGVAAEAARSDPYTPYIGFSDGFRFGGKDSPVLALGPSGMGKTSGSLIPSLMLSAYSLAVISSSRSDIYQATASWLGKFGIVWSYLNPHLPGAKELRFSPLQGLDTWSKASAFGKRWLGYIDMSAVALSGETKGQAHFRQWGGRFLAALCLYANLTHKTIFDVRDWCTNPQPMLLTKIKGELVKMATKDANVAAEVIGGYLQMHGGERSGVASSAAASMAPFDDEDVIASCQDADFDPQSAVDGYPDAFSNVFGTPHPVTGAWPIKGRGDAIFITTGDAEAGYMPLILELLWRVKDAAYKRAERMTLAGQEVKLPVRLYLDELAAAPLPALPQLLAEHRNRGVMIHGGLQSLSQAEHLYGKLGQDFLSLWRTVLVYPGIKDGQTLELISKLAGEFPQEVFGSSEQKTSDWTSNVSYTFRPRLPIDEIAKGHKDNPQAVLVLDERIDLRWVEARRYYQEPFAEMLVESAEHSVENGLGRYPLPKLDDHILAQLGLLDRWKAVKAAVRRD